MARKEQDNAPAPAAQPACKVVERGKDRWWKVRDPWGELVCVTVYKWGAVEVVRRLAGVTRGGTAAVANALRLLRRFPHVERSRRTVCGAS